MINRINLGSPPRDKSTAVTPRFGRVEVVMSNSADRVRIGVLALQGAFAEHIAVLRQLDAAVDAVEIRSESELVSC